MVRVRAGIVSITGNFRDNNEDNAVVDPAGRFFVVADGMGGQAAGEKASQLAVEIIPRKLTSAIDFEETDQTAVPASIDHAVGHANSEIMALGQLDPKFNQMGTTVALVVHVGETFYVGNVGDSRVYRLADGALEQLTKDHSLIQALCDAGTITAEEARHHRYKNVLYRYLGSPDGAKGADVKTIRPAAGERYLICSDGVTDGLDAATLAATLGREGDPQAVAEAVVLAAQEGGSKDNITAIVLFVD